MSVMRPWRRLLSRHHGRIYLLLARPRGRDVFVDAFLSFAEVAARARLLVSDSGGISVGRWTGNVSQGWVLLVLRKRSELPSQLWLGQFTITIACLDLNASPPDLGDPRGDHDLPA